MEFILKSVDNYEINKSVLVQGDVHSVWAYIIDITDKRDEIEFDGFICSRGTILHNKKQIEYYVNHDEGYAPPLLEEYKNKYSIVCDLLENEVKIDWQNNIVKVYVRGIEYLIMDIDSKKSYSKAVSKSGAYGLPLD